MKDETESTNIPSKERKNTFTVLEAFDLLKTSKDESRLNGGAKIISLLQGNKNERETLYTLKRLVRSLGANHPDNRMGYFATLTTMLRNFDNISLTQLLDLVKKELHASGSSKSEVGDVSLGQILVCGSVLRSGLFIKSSTEEQNQLIDLLFNASSKKSYLSIVSYMILIDFINTLDNSQFSSIIWANIKKHFKKDLKEHSLDSLFFLMVVNKKFPGVVKLRKLLGVEAILCEDTIHTVGEKLMAGIDFNSVNHPIYKEIGIIIANSPQLSTFWISGIDTHLVKHNRNRELVALNLLKNILDNMQDNFEIIPDLLSDNFFKLFMDWFKGLQTASKVRNKRDEEEDYKLMIKKEREILSALSKVLKSEKVDNKVRVKILKKLLLHPGDINFNELTGTTVTKSILADLDKDGVKKIAKLFKGVLLNTSKKFVKEDLERNWYNNERLKAAEGISYLLGHDSVKDDTEFKLNYMRLLMCFGFFKITSDDTAAVSTELSSNIKTCFYRCFNSRFSNVDSLVTVLSSLCNFINKSLQKEKIENQFAKENMDCWKMLSEVCRTIEKNENMSKVEKVFLILLYQLGLFLFSEPKHVEMATSSIKELKSCYDHYKKGKKKSQIKEGDLVEDEPEWMEVLVEVLLSILSTGSSVLRSIVQCVFRLLYEHMTPSSIGQIISVLDPESVSNPLTEDSEDSGNESDVSNDDEKLTSNEEGGNSNEESDGSDSDADEDAEMKTPDQLRIAIQKALGTAAPDTDTESIDADMIDDEEGKKLDAALAEAFKQFSSGKNLKSKKERKNKKALSDFRIRVLDLIDIYLEKEPSLDITLGMIAPLIRSLEFCIQDNEFVELEKRLRKTIKILTKIRKFSSVDGVTANILCDYLKSVIEKGSRSQLMFQALGDVITQCATFIIHCSQKIDLKKKGCKKSNSELREIVKNSLQSYLQNRNCLLPIIFFHSILQTDWDGVYELIPILIHNSFNVNVRQFRRNEALELMAGFYRSLKQIKPESENTLNMLSTLEIQFDKTVRDTLNNDNDQFIAKRNFFVILKKLIDTMKGFHESCHIKTSVDFKSLLDIIVSRKNVAKVSDIGTKKAQQGTDKKHKAKKNKKRKTELMNGHAEPKSKKKKNNLINQLVT